MCETLAMNTEGTKRLVGVVPGSLVSGAESVLLRDVIAARDAGWHIRVACSDGPFVVKLQERGVERIKIPDLRLRDGNRLVAFVWAAASALIAAIALRRKLESGDIILANSINVLPATALISGRHRVVYFGHDVLIRRDRLALLKLLRRSVFIAVAVSDAVARTIRSAGIPTKVIHNGTAWPVRPSTPQDRSVPPTIGIAAVITPWKGHHVLLDAFALLQHQDAHLEIMGGVAPKDAQYAAELRERTLRADLRGRVIFLGHVDTPLDRMRSWTIAVLPSTDPEAGPLTALEAMSVGVPVVGTDHGGMVEVMGSAGILVPPGDARSLATAIDRLLGDRELCAQCGDAGPRQIVAHKLTLADHESRMLDLFDSVAAG